MTMQMTSLLNPIHHLLFYFILFTKSSYSSSQTSNSSVNFCPEIERHSLLTVKQSLQDPDNRLSSWGDGEAMNCCKWEGIVCNNSTGHVSHLHLQSYHLGGKINSSLANLKHLSYLDLSNNDFHGETIPSFIGSLSSLEYLNLSNARFMGKIATTIGNLSNLHTLDLEGTDSLEWDDDQLEFDNLEWLSGLSKLEYVNLNYADLSRASNRWAKVINSLPCLLELHLSYCYINPSRSHVYNLSTSLTLIDFSFNFYVYGYAVLVPQWFFQLKNLVSLDLSSNSFFSGKIPTFSNATKLRFLDLSYNIDLNSSNIPKWIYLCKDLEFLHLGGNSIQGQISASIGNLTSLESLHLGYNSLSGRLPREITNLCRLRLLNLSGNRELQGELRDLFGNMSSDHCFLGSLRFLEELYLSHNSLSGSIPISIGNLPSLKVLQLNHNRFTGNLPASLSRLFKLIEFNIENNKLEGIVTERHFANPSNLEIFSASGNHLTLSVGLDWLPPKKIRTLGLGSWSLGAGSSKIPSWLQKRINNIVYLDLSNTGISGTAPTWIFNISYLNISNNNLHGKIPYNLYGFKYMSRNNFSGSLPRIRDTAEVLDLSHNLFSEGLSDFLCSSIYRTHRLNSLLLEGNRLSGELPNCWQKFPSLYYLNLGNNTMHGSLPNSLGFLHHLWSLNLYGNRFSGQIPFSMRNCTNLSKMDLGSNDIDGNVPTWIGTNLMELKILILRSNKFSGGIPSELCHLQSLQILDLSRNRISGVVPKCFQNLTAMATKRSVVVQNFLIAGFVESASVEIKGLKLEYSTILSLVTNIDLSSNHLRGEIPKELTSLVELRSLNLSRNQLSGSIPDGIGKMKQLESLDLSSNSLSGQIPIGFTLLSSLSFLNLSFNSLSGRIPQSTQLQSMDASRYIGNDLCGFPLARTCINSDGEDEAHGLEGAEGKGKIEWMYVFLSLGYAVGFSGVCSVLVLKKSWREAYFGLLERIWDKLYVYFHVWIKKF